MSEKLKEWAQNAALLFFALLLLAGLYDVVHGSGSGKYRVTVQSDGYSSSYRTDNYTIKGNCIRFKCWNDSMIFCGSYRVR